MLTVNLVLKERSKYKGLWVSKGSGSIIRTIAIIIVGIITLGLQIAQSRSHLRTLGPKIGIICILGALGLLLLLHMTCNYGLG